MKKQTLYISLEEFGKRIGLSKLDREIIKLKIKLIVILKEARVKSKISQAELAKRIGTKQPAVARMEAGDVGDISLDYLIRAALALRVPLEILPIK
jgi:DNA-binding XRE family transcriptional regulator